MVIKNDWQKLCVVVLSQNLFFDGLSEIVENFRLVSMVLIGCQDLLIKENVCIFMFLKLELSLTCLVFTSISIFLNLLRTYLINKLIIETIPFVCRLCKGIVMSSLWRSWVNNCASKRIGEIFFISWVISCKVVSSIFLHV